MKWILKLHKTAHFAHLSWGYFQHRCYPDCFGFTFCPYWTMFTLQIVIVFAFLLSFCFFLFLANQLFFWMSSHVSLWSNVSFYFAVLINLIVAFFYPFSSADAGRSSYPFDIHSSVSTTTGGYCFVWRHATCCGSAGGSLHLSVCPNPNCVITIIIIIIVIFISGWQTATSRSNESRLKSGNI